MSGNRTGRAFTLVEVLIVILILAILAAIVLPRYENPVTAAQISSVGSQLRTLRGQIELFRAQNGGRSPDFANQWDEMLAQGLIAEEPINPRTGSSVVVFGDGPDQAGPQDGWVWNQQEERLFAAFYDEQTRTFTGP